MTATLPLNEMESPLTSHPGAAALKAAGTALSRDDCLSYGASLAGKVVVITGAGSGFGRTYALRAGALGAKVVASDLAKASIDAVVQEIVASGGTAIGVVCNVTDWDQQVAMFRAAITSFGAVDVCVVNAGIAEAPAWISGDVDASGEPKRPSFAVLDVNIVGASYTVNLAFHHLNKNPSTGHKAIVVLGSMSSFLPIPGAPMYTMSKHAMLGLARSTYYNGLADKINVNLVAPWFVHTPILGTGARVLIAGLPLATVPDVVDAMVYASSVNDSGLSLCIDPSGVLSVPQSAFDLGKDGFYHVFETRARGVISLAKTCQDLLKALDQSPVGGVMWVLGAVVAGGAAYAATRGAMSWSQGTSFWGSHGFF